MCGIEKEFNDGIAYSQLFQLDDFIPAEVEGLAALFDFGGEHIFGNLLRKFDNVIDAERRRAGGWLGGAPGESGRQQEGQRENRSMCNHRSHR